VCNSQGACPSRCFLPLRVSRGIKREAKRKGLLATYIRSTVFILFITYYRMFTLSYDCS